MRTATPEEIARRCGSGAHQGICAEVGGYPYVSADELLGEDHPLIVALDQVQDPQNLGSICRTAECAGATGVVIPERRAAEVTPAVCKASAGAVEHLRVARVRNLADFLGEAQKAGCWSYGASAGAANALPPPRLLRRGGAGARQRGPRSASPRGGGVRRADRAAAVGADRVGRRLCGRGRDPVRDLAQSLSRP